MEDEKISYEYFEFVSPYNILVVTHDGEIINVQCPFKVKAKVDFPEIKAKESVWVQKVLIAEGNKDVFIIDENAYHVGHFKIIL